MSITLDGSQGITTPTYGGTDTSEYLVPVTAFKNRIINGAMMIDQRNAGASVSFSGSSAYTLDRWKAQSPAGTIQQITSTISNFANSLKYTSTGSNAYVQIGQQIEYNNCYDLQNQTVSISFSIKANNSNSGSTALTVRTRTGATINGSIIFSGTNVDTSVTISTTATTYTVTRALPSTFGALSLEFVLGSHVSGDGFEVTGVQLEKGSTATSFDYRPYGQELNLCQRYYWQQTQASLQFPTIATGTVMTSTSFRMNIQYRQTMRTAPSITISSSGTVDVTVGATASAINVITAAYSTPESSLTDCSLTVASTVGQSGVAFLAQTNSFIRFSSEL